MLAMPDTILPKETHTLVNKLLKTESEQGLLSLSGFAEQGAVLRISRAWTQSFKGFQSLGEANLKPPRVPANLEGKPQSLLQLRKINLPTSFIFFFCSGVGFFPCVVD